MICRHCGCQVIEWEFLNIPMWIHPAKTDPPRVFTCWRRLGRIAPGLTETTCAEPVTLEELRAEMLEILP